MHMSDAGGKASNPFKDATGMEEKRRAARASSVCSKFGVDLIQKSEDEQRTESGYEAAKERCDNGWNSAEESETFSNMLGLRLENV